MKAGRDMESLSKMLHSIDGQSYGAYRRIKGEYLSTKPSIRLSIEYVQGDPFASPSRISVFIPAQTTHLDSSLFASLLSRRTTADFCLRLFSDIVQGYSQRSGSGKSGQIFVDEPSQEILSRSAASLDSDGCLKLGFYIGLPARGRRILGFQAQKLLVQTLPRLIQAFVGTLDQSWADLKEHIRVQQLQHTLRSQLKPNGLVAFVRDGSVLVRQSGHSDLPLDREEAVPWRGPPAMQVRLKGLCGEDIIGTGIPKGVT
ncbi:MAG: ABC-ATPase domain-containing protein, partial [Myxococcota bacterium]|nr:ABC-ATPase domain-containing protein [Myxococcota bacterium]